MNRLFKTVMLLMAGLLLSIVLVASLVLRALKPAPDEWVQELGIGPINVEVSMPAALRIATHPFVLTMLEGRSFHTRHGIVHWQAGDKRGTWRAVCAPCTWRANGVGAQALRVSRAEFTVMPDAEMNLRGGFALGNAPNAPNALHGRWSSRIDKRRVAFDFRVDDEPVSQVFHLFGADIPELARARIDGRLSVKASWALPSGELQFKPRVEGLAVSGLGTEALLNARPACGFEAYRNEPVDSDESGIDLRATATGTTADPGLPDFGPWLPRAVVAAEDQRFAEHAGFDLAETMSAWVANQREGAAIPAGASTLPQQLAKLVYTGDQRSHGRKLRELMYAVELDRTLGKGRVLSLYLAMAPWGGGQCGADAASWALFKKPPSELNAIEAVWLATLLRNPDRELALLARRGEVDRERLAWMAEQMRPMGKREREVLRHAAKRWSPPDAALKFAKAVSAGQGVSQAEAGR